MFRDVWWRQYFASRNMTAFEDGTAINDLTRRIPEKLGTPFTSGSFGKVYRCSIKTTKGKVEVAVKVFISDPSNPVEGFEKRIRRELKVWLKLKHPSIVPLLGIAYIDSPLPALVSQWMSSGTLCIYLKEAIDITVFAKVRLARGVADGLNYLHSENVIHGDLHPENVLIDGSGNPCLTDFGLATVEGEAELQLNTMTAERSFNSRWRAPEVIGIERGPERPNFKSDIYSFGSVAFFIFSGDSPWREKNSVQICIALSNKIIHARPENILDDQWNLIQQCWSWEPGNRPSAAKILVSIDQSIDHLQDLPSRRSIARQRFKGAVRSVIMLRQQQARQTLQYARPFMPPMMQTPLYSRPFMPPRTPSFDRSSTRGDSQDLVSRQSIARQRFKRAVRFVIMMQQQQTGRTSLNSRPSMPPRTPSFDRSSTRGDSQDLASRQSIARQRFKRVVRFVIMMPQQQTGRTSLNSRPSMPPRTPSFDQSSTRGDSQDLASRQSIARQRFKGAVRSVIMMQQQQTGRTPLYSRPSIPQTPSFDWSSTRGVYSRSLSSASVHSLASGNSIEEEFS